MNTVRLAAHSAKAFLDCVAGCLGVCPTVPCPVLSCAAGVPTGTPLSDPPLVSAISEDPLLRNVKLIAEAWDCDGLYQVGGMG